MAEVKIVGKMDNTIDHTFESSNRVYDKSGLWDTIPTCGGGNIQPKIIEDFYANRPARVYEEVSPTIRAERAGLKVIDLYNETVKDDGICGTLTASGGLGWKNCGSFGVIEKSESDKIIVAMRGRNPENPTDRTAGIHTEQRLEPNLRGVSNTLTTVQKDNLVQERGCQYRIRKLTARECWRLMGYCDSDFNKASAVVSQTQLYKQAGNAIIKQVLMGIFSQLIDQKEAV